jgi:multisubunit Na+/H+ antiporter MnhB subunit
MEKRDILGMVFLTIVAVILIFGVLFVHPFGDPDFKSTPVMDNYIIENTQAQTGADNGVTSVVFDYRGFDTLGEATVLFTAVAGVIMIFRRLQK